MPINSNEQLQEALSMAVSDRSAGYQDLVSNSNALLYMMMKNKMWKSYSGPTIRETLAFAESDTYTRYSGFDLLNPKPADLIGDAEFKPKQAAVTVALSQDQLLGNMGSKAQLLDLMETRLDLAENELKDRFCEDLHSDGTADGGRQIGGLLLAIPSDPTVGTYGGINRATTPVWRTKSFVTADFAGKVATVPADLRNIFTRIAIATSQGKNGPSMILASDTHYTTIEQSFTDIQRITKVGGAGEAGFTTLLLHAGGRSMEIVLEGGQGTAMPANTSYFLRPEDLAFRYHPDRNFKPFGGKQAPINQDAIVQHIGIMGELVLKNPRHAAKFVG